MSEENPNELFPKSLAAVMHLNTANALAQIAEYLKEHPMACSQIIEWLGEMAAEMEAAAALADLKEDLNL